MASYKGHISWALVWYGCILLISCFFLLPFRFSFQHIFALCLGSLFPDVDTKSKGQKIFYWLLCCAFIYALSTHQQCLALCLGFLGFLPLLVSHRGIFHNTFFVGFLVTSGSLVLAHSFPACAKGVYTGGLFFFIGAVSHIVVDVGFRRALRL